MALDTIAKVGDPTATPTTKSGEAKAKLADDLDSFLTLLTTQLQHQDPLDPMDATEFTDQLVQFASVEQAIYQNSNLEKLITMQESTQLASIVNYIGMDIEAKGGNLPLKNGTSTFTYKLADEAAKVTVSIAKSDGTVVYTKAVETSAGKHALTWDGKDNLGNQLADGSYIVTVSALDDSESPMEVEQTVIGGVTGVEVEDGEATLYMGQIGVPMDSLLTIQEPKETETDTSSS